MTDKDAVADLFVPDGTAEGAAMARVTHLGIGAHPDDLELMAYHGIVQCHRDAHSWFGGITCTDGAGSPRAGEYADHTDEQMVATRRAEQREAARIGKYGVMVQLGHASTAIKEQAGWQQLAESLFDLLDRTRPEIVYTHCLTDRHETHIAVALAALAALRRLSDAARPRRVYGCEAWGDLDWMLDDDVVTLDVGEHPELAERLIGVFASQIAGGKRYDLAAPGRRRAHATFRASHAVDRLEQVALAMDLTPLSAPGGPPPAEYVDGLLQRFRDDVAARLQRRESAADH